MPVLQHCDSILVSHPGCAVTQGQTGHSPDVQAHQQQAPQAALGNLLSLHVRQAEQPDSRLRAIEPSSDKLPAQQLARTVCLARTWAISWASTAASWSSDRKTLSRPVKTITLPPAQQQLSQGTPTPIPRLNASAGTRTHLELPWH